MKTRHSKQVPYHFQENKSLTLEEAYTRHHAGLLRHAYRLCGMEAEDIEQQVWVRACANWEHLRQDNVWGWLYTILHNLVTDWQRSTAHRLNVHLSDDFQLLVDSPEEQVDEILSVGEAIQKLQLRDRRILGTVVQFRTSAQAAEALGLSGSSYRLALLRARRRLARILA